MNKYNSRKFAAFIISLITIVVCAFLEVDVSVGVGTLFSIYCIGNVSSKFVSKREDKVEEGR